MIFKLISNVSTKRFMALSLTFAIGGCANGLSYVNEGGRFMQLMVPTLGDQVIFELETSSNARCIQMAENTPRNNQSNQLKARCAMTSSPTLKGEGYMINKSIGETMNIKTLTKEACLQFQRSANATGTSVEEYYCR